jgi:hypothetical protein
VNPEHSSECSMMRLDIGLQALGRSLRRCAGLWLARGLIMRSPSARTCPLLPSVVVVVVVVGRERETSW